MPPDPPPERPGRVAFAEALRFWLRLGVVGAWQSPELLALVGVIVNLALFFAVHVLWPQGFGGAFDAAAAAIAVAAAIALWRFGRGMIEVLLACAAAGLVVHLLR